MFCTSLFSLLILCSIQISMASAPASSQTKSGAEQPKADLKKRIVSKAHSAALQQKLFAPSNSAAAPASSTTQAAAQSDELAKAIAENIELRKQLAEKEKQRQHYLVWTELGLILAYQNDLTDKIQATCPKAHFPAHSPEEWKALLKKIKVESTSAKWCPNPAAYIADNSNQKD